MSGKLYFDDGMFLFILRRNKNPIQRHANEQAKRDGSQEMKRWKRRIIIFSRASRLKRNEGQKMRMTSLQGSG